MIHADEIITRAKILEVISSTDGQGCYIEMYFKDTNTGKTVEVDIHVNDISKILHMISDARAAAFLDSDRFDRHRLEAAMKDVEMMDTLRKRGYTITRK